MPNFENHHKTHANVVLLAMPGTPIAKPSLGLSLLKASLADTQYSIDVLYANLFFQKEIGDLSLLFDNSPSHTQIWEWIFSKLLFPKFEIDDIDYLNEVVRYYLKRVKIDVNDENITKYVNKYKEIRSKTNGFIDSLAKLIVNKKPRIVGCSSIFFQHVSSLVILKRVKEISPEITTIMGGPNCAGEMGIATVSEFPFVDFIFSGEADLTFPKFVNEVFTKPNINDWNLHTSIIDRKRAKRITDSHNDVPYKQVADLNSLPTPDFSDYYTAYSDHKEIPVFRKQHNRVIQIEASRGCWWFEKVACTFCGLNPGDKKYRTKSAQKVIKEMDTISDLFKPNVFMFTDNVLNMKTFNEFVSHLKTAQPNYELFFEVKSDLKKDMIKKLSEAKIMYVQAGIESLHDDILKIMRKGTTAIGNIQFLKDTKQFGIDVIWNYIWNFPGEKQQSYNEMCTYIPLITHLKPPSTLVEVGYQRFSEYFNNYKEYNLNLKPIKYYNYVYPFSEERLSKLAYFFSDAKRFDKIDSINYFNLRSCLKEWKNKYIKKNCRPILQMTVKDKEILITDTRDCATNKNHILKGKEALIYKYCDSVSLEKKIYAKFEQEMTIDNIYSILQNLVQKKLLLKINNKYLSLAIPKL